MIKLKNSIYENILRELSENNTLYHRSFKKMKVGDIIKPRIDKKGIHWLANIAFELVLEEYRKDKFPDKPTRLNCVYSSVVPKSRFAEKGYLYVIKPLGKTLMTNSSYIDILADRFSREELKYYDRGIEVADIKANPKNFVYDLDIYLAQKYWKGDIPNIKSKLKDVEILSESAQIIEVIDEPNKLIAGNNIRVTESNKIYVNLTLYFEEEMIDKYEQKTDGIFNQFIENAGDLFTDGGNEKLTTYTYGKKYGNLQFTGYLRKGVKLKILFIEGSNYRKYEYDDEYTSRPQGKYKQMLFGFYLKNKYFDRTKNKETNGLPDYKMQYGDFYESDKKDRVRDISKFLKKVK